jgi:hypothetical protein
MYTGTLQDVSWTVYDPLAAMCLTEFSERLVADMG